MFKTWFSVRTVLVGLLTVGLFGVAGPVVAVNVAAPTGVVQHEYRLIYATDYGTGLVPIPQPPPGVTYIKWETIAISPSGQWSGALLRSDGRMVGFGEGGLKAVATINAEFPDAKIIDFTELRTMGAYLIFADGTVHRTSTLAERGGPFSSVPGEWSKEWLAGPWDMPHCVVPPGRFVRFLSGGRSRLAFEMALLRADGRMTSFRMEDASPPLDYTAKNCPTTIRSDYVGGRISGLSGANDFTLNLTALLRRDGRVDLLNDYYLRHGVPRLPKGVKYVGVAGDALWIMAYLRSDGKMVYRAAEDYQLPVKEQPPGLPVGLRYVSLESWFGSWIVMRSDGQAVLLKGGHSEFGVKYGYRPGPLPWLAKGWRYVLGAVPRGKETAFLVEKIPFGEKVATGIEKIMTPKSVRKGKAVKVTVKVASRAILEGGTVKVTYKGKTVGRAKVKGTKAVVRIKTGAMKSKGKNTIGVQYLGNLQGKKSAKAKATVTTRV